jgi:hypothetical protein
VCLHDHHNMFSVSFPRAGTCGTACCGLEFDIAMTVQTFVQTFERTMRANGTDGQYRYVDQDARDLPNMLQVPHNHFLIPSPSLPPSSSPPPLFLFPPPGNVASAS